MIVASSPDTAVAPERVDRRSGPSPEIRAELTARFLNDSPVAEVSHVVLGLTVAGLLVGIHSSAGLALWLAMLLTATAIRYRVRRRLAQRPTMPATLSLAVYLSIVAVGFTWAAGATALVQADQGTTLHLVMIVECGLAAAATSTFVTNTAAFRVFVASIFLPLIVGILRLGLTRASLTSALLVVVFGAVMAALNRRGHDSVVRSLELQHDLERSRTSAVAQRASAEEAEVTIRESEQRLFQLVESMPVGVIVVDAHGDLYYGNAAAQAIGGPGLRGTPTPADLEQIYPVFVPGTNQAYPRERLPAGRALSGESVVDQFEVLGPGGRRLIEARGSPIRDRAGDVVYGVAVMSDLSERQEGEARRSALTAVLQLTADATSEWGLLEDVLPLLNERFGFALSEMWTVDADAGLIRRMGSSHRGTDALIAAFDRSSTNLTLPSGVGLAGSVWKSSQPIWRNRLVADDKMFIREGGAVEANLRTAVAVPVFVAGVLNGALVLFSTDAREPDGAVTDTLMAIGAQVGGAIGRRRADAVLRAAEDRYRQLFDASSDMMWEVDLGGRWKFVNAASRRIYGIAPGDLIGKLFSDRADGDHTQADAAMFARLSHGEVITEYETGHCDATGAAKAISTSAAPIRDGSGQIVGFHGILRDVGDRAAARDALRAARDTAEQAAAAKSAFLANMSHEIRTPMNGVLGFVELLLDSNLDEEQRRAVELIATSGRGLLEVINEILDYSKIEANQLEIETTEVDLHALVTSTVKIAAAGIDSRRVAIVTDIGPDVPGHIVGDPTRLRQVLTNLISNAVKFTHAGEIVVSVEHVASESNVARLRFVVRDTGIGMSAETAAAIFEPFRQADSSTTRRYGGTGLGLTISRRLVELMGGTLEVSSEVGVGSRFSFELTVPVATEPAAVPAAHARKTIQLVSRPLRILVAEDNRINQAVARANLGRRGHSVDVVADGRAAVEAVMGTDYDVVLMDVQMPELDGLEATREIRARRPLPRPRIIALTANALAGERERCLAAGMDGYLSKPYLPADLFAIVEGDTGAASDDAVPPTPTPRTTGAPVDLDGLRSEMRAAGIEDSVPILLGLFLRDGAEGIAAIVAAADAGDLPALSRAAHAMKSASGTVRATHLASLLGTIEGDARAGLQGAMSQVSGIVAEHDLVRKWLDAPGRAGSPVA
jgi:PAS domain S-box-containing protein